jgi:hypothetical protein
LNDAILLLDSGTKDEFGRNWNVSHSLGLYLFAIEEYGKALKLKDYWLTMDSSGLCRVDRGLFEGNRAHRIKFQRAYDSVFDLPDNCRIKNVGIHVTNNSEEYGKKVSITKSDDISFGAGATGLFTLQTLSDQRVRERCFYVGFDEANGEWAYELTTDGSDLKNCMINLLNHIPSLYEPLHEEFRNLHYG